MNLLLRWIVNLAAVSKRVAVVELLRNFDDISVKFNAIVMA
jgi:hypothetical protein